MHNKISIVFQNSPKGTPKCFHLFNYHRQKDETWGALQEQDEIRKTHIDQTLNGVNKP